MVPNTQFQLNPAAQQQGTGQQVNNWVDHTAQGMPEFQGGPQMMHPMGAAGGPVAQPLTQPGQPVPLPPVPAPTVMGPNGQPIPAPPQHPDPTYNGTNLHTATAAQAPFYDPSLPDQGRSLYQNAVDAWHSALPPTPGAAGAFTPGMSRDARHQAIGDWHNTNDAYRAARPQWIVKPDPNGQGPVNAKPDTYHWPRGGGYSA